MCVPQEQIEKPVVEDPEEQELGAVETPGAVSIRSANEELIEKVLKKHAGNRKAAAAELEISERTLYRKIKSMNLDNDR
jgi:transcriptional regulator with PAS, ATPase and Fis domain